MALLFFCTSAECCRPIVERLNMNSIQQRLLGAAAGLLTSELARGPWRSKSFLAAVTAMLVGLGLWVADAFKSGQLDSNGTTPNEIAQADPQGIWARFHQPVPGYVRVSASYIGGFILGWAFRSFLKLVVVASCFVVGIVGLGRYAGWDTSTLQTRIEHQAAGLRERAAHTRDFLQGKLPSGMGGGVGALLGWRRRSRSALLNTGE